MAISTGYSSLRRTLAQRLNYWGGDISNNGPGALSANGTKNTAVDITRAEPDDYWNESWIVLNPGSTDQVNLPTIWRRIAVDSGWVQSTGTFNIQGTWPSPYTNGPTAGVSYELYQVFRPEAWLQALNWALTNSYPKRHVGVTFEVPQDSYGRIIKWGDLVKNLKITDPTIAPSVSEVPNGQGTFQPGTYTFAYTFYNDLGETLQSPTVNLAVTGTNSQIAFADITSVPAAVLGANYYSSIIPGDSQLGLLSIGNSFLTSQPPPANYTKALNKDGVIKGITFNSAYGGYSAFPPIYNTTNVDVQELHHILKRVNPGNFPEIFNDLGSDLYKPMGNKSILLMYLPLTGQSLRLVCSAVTPVMVKETDVTDEPPEMLYAGAEAYLWNLLQKTSTIVNTNWQTLYKEALTTYNDLKDAYALDVPRTIAFRPAIRTSY
jgi:hypothetical protein